MSSTRETSKMQQFRAAYVRRMKYALHTETPKRVKIGMAVLFLCSLVGLVSPITAIFCAFFGLVQSLRLLHAPLYPFSFSRGLLYAVRIEAALTFVLGVVGIVLNWSDIHPYLKPVFDWINE